MATSALILFAHGARDPKWAAPFQRLQQLIQPQLPDVLVTLGFLELMSPRLPELVPQLIAAGCVKASVVPVFLGQGGHVMRDLPVMIEQLQKEYPEFSISVADAVGENPLVLQAIASYCIASLNE